MKKTSYVMIAAACAALAGGVGYAQTIPGMAGVGDGCFAISGAAISGPAKTNMCFEGPGVTRRLLIPTQAYGYGWYNQVFARATGNGNTTQTTCRAVSSNSNGSLAMITPFGVTDFSLNTTTMPLGSIFVPTSGTLHFECNVAQGGGRVQNVEI